MMMKEEEEESERRRKTINAGVSMSDCERMGNQYSSGETDVFISTSLSSEPPQTSNRYFLWPGQWSAERLRWNCLYLPLQKTGSLQGQHCPLHCAVIHRAQSVCTLRAVTSRLPGCEGCYSQTDLLFVRDCGSSAIGVHLPGLSAQYTCSTYRLVQ